MSDQGEKTCPLCAEEMDLTDQQLKPCKCGYEICVWCWHHLMDMAEKDETEGRCPACRTPYNKEKIVGMAANCERLVAEMNVEKKVKSQKAKGKLPEGRNQLNSVRVIQRNLVYIVGLPLNLADEDLLQRREYFGQYGKVLKVSISRTAAGAIQHFANNTCSVYITYGKEEEAVRCIQSVHGFVLDGRSLRACFGTTKYCHAWLRNVPCSNPDCLYLHDVGSQEDSFTKDEVISAYTRSRVQQITGATNNMQGRSGNVLPPPADEFYINSSVSSGNPISKSASNNLASSVRGSPPKSGSDQSIVPPATASWGARASNSPQPSSSLVCSNGLSKQKPEICTASVAFSTAVAGTPRAPALLGDIGKKLIPSEEHRTIVHKGKQEPLEPFRRCVTASEAPVTPGLSVTSTVNGGLYSPPTFEDKDRCNDLSGRSYGSGPDKDLNVPRNANNPKLCSDMASLTVDKHHSADHPGNFRHNSSLCDNILVNSPQNQEVQQCTPVRFREPLTPPAFQKPAAPSDNIAFTREQSDQRSDFVARKQSDWRSDTQTRVINTDSQVSFSEGEEDLRYFQDQRLKDPEVVTRTSYFPNSSLSFNHSNHSRLYSRQQNEPSGTTSVNLDLQIGDKKTDQSALQHVAKLPNGYANNNMFSSSVNADKTGEQSYWTANEEKKQIRRFEGNAANADQKASADMGESSIISNILSMDCDAWDESLTSPQNFAKLFGKTDRRQGSLDLSNSWKTQNTSQSRFLFARQEESKNRVYDVKPSVNNFGQVLNDRVSNNGFHENGDFNFDQHGGCNGFSTFNVRDSDNLVGSLSQISSNKLSAVSRAQNFAPPGFSAPNRAPPPGFASHERMEPTFDSMPGNQMFDAPSLLRNPYQAPPTRNISNVGDIEFMDPAILAVGKGRLAGGFNNAPALETRQNFPSQLSSFENDARLQLLMQRSLSPVQNQRFADMRDGFPLGDTYGIPSRVMQQTQPSSLSPFSLLSRQQSRNGLMSNGQWDGWSEVQGGNDAGTPEHLRTEILGFNNLYSGYEDPKFRPSSGDLYNKTYGI